MYGDVFTGRVRVDDLLLLLSRWVAGLLGRCLGRLRTVGLGEPLTDFRERDIVVLSVAAPRALHPAEPVLFEQITQTQLYGRPRGTADHEAAVDLGDGDALLPAPRQRLGGLVDIDADAGDRARLANELRGDLFQAFGRGKRLTIKRLVVTAVPLGTPAQ